MFLLTTVLTESFPSLGFCFPQPSGFNGSRSQPRRRDQQWCSRISLGTDACYCRPIEYYVTACLAFTWYGCMLRSIESHWMFSFHQYVLANLWKYYILYGSRLRNSLWLWTCGSTTWMTSGASVQSGWLWLVAHVYVPA